IPIIMQIEGSRFNPAVELALWTAFSIFMPSLAILAGSFNGLRKQLMEANQKLTDLNNFDGLTGVKNRSCFNQQFDHEWRRSQRTGDEVSLLMIDIDNFKTINDTYGHLGGDACLKHVATIIKDTARRLTDGAFRYGGEEFAVLLAATDSIASNNIANAIRKLVEEANIIFDGKRIPVTVSIGVATMTPDENNPLANDILIVHADNALYQAKKRGRNRVCIFTPVWDEDSQNLQDKA
ncbi:MAG: GGDEF domain-containing protein, partial [Moraxellaceae bacterium]